MTDLPAVAIWLGVVLLLSLATLPVFAQWRKRDVSSRRQDGPQEGNR